MARPFTGRSRSTQNFSRGPRRKTSWIIGPKQDTTSKSVAGASLWATGIQTGQDGNTIVRIRGQISGVLEVVTAVGDGFDNSAFGIGLVTDEAFAAGVTSIPGPLSDDDWDGWMWHQFLGPIIGQSVTELGVAPMEAFRFDIDSKSMRKFEEGMTVVGVIELGSETGAATLKWGGRTRMLIKLP